MSTRTWIVMLVVLALNWGGFAAALIYGLRKQVGPAEDRSDEPLA